MEDHRFHSFIYHLNRIETSLEKIIELLKALAVAVDPKPESIYETKTDEYLANATVHHDFRDKEEN